MDRGLYVAMTGAKQIMQAQAVNNHNIANLSTIGFRADAVSFDSHPIYGPGYATRVNAVAGDAGVDFSMGVMQSTGRDLDIAVNGKGFIAVRGTDGKEAYTLSDQKTPEKFAAKKVTVIGTLDVKTKKIQVESITAAK